MIVMLEERRDAGVEPLAGKVYTRSDRKRFVEEQNTEALKTKWLRAMLAKSLIH